MYTDLSTFCSQDWFSLSVCKCFSFAEKSFGVKKIHNHRGDQTVMIFNKF